MSIENIQEIATSGKAQAVAIMQGHSYDDAMVLESELLNDESLGDDKLLTMDKALDEMRHQVIAPEVTANLPATTTHNLPDITSATGNLAQYLHSVSQYPMLAVEEEKQLAIELRDKQDLQAAHKLVTSHLRLVAKIAFGYRGYGLPVADLVSEGNIGLLQAVKNFDPERGNRLATYAMWWIKASINDYVLKSWSLVKIGTSGAQKKLFFNLRRLRNKIKQHDDTYYLTDDEAKQISSELDVSVKDVKQMEVRMVSSDQSLNAPMGKNNTDGDNNEWLSVLPDERGNQEDSLIALKQHDYQKELIQRALQTLPQREREILQARKLQEKPPTLEHLGKIYGISRERIRQLENQAMKNFKKAILLDTEEDNHDNHTLFLT